MQKASYQYLISENSTSPTPGWSFCSYHLYVGSLLTVPVLSRYSLPQPASSKVPGVRAGFLAPWLLAALLPLTPRLEEPKIKAKKGHLKKCLTLLRTVIVQEGSYRLPPELSFTSLQWKGKSNPTCNESNSCCLLLALLLGNWKAEEITHPEMEMPVRNHQATEPARTPTHRPGMFHLKLSVILALASSDTLMLFDGKLFSLLWCRRSSGNSNSLTLCGVLNGSQSNDNTGNRPVTMLANREQTYRTICWTRNSKHITAVKLSHKSLTWGLSV